MLKIGEELIQVEYDPPLFARADGREGTHIWNGYRIIKKELFYEEMKIKKEREKDGQK